MSTAAAAINGKVLLVSAPWPLFNRPSLPLGALKAYLQQEIPSLQVSTSHFFLIMAHALGYDRYHAISQRVWRAEAVFSALLYPEQALQAEALYRDTIKPKDLAEIDFQQLVRQVATVTNQWLAGIDWTALDLVGFSISFCQVTASLYLISMLKAAFPSLPVVVGGSSFSARQSKETMAAFPQIDYWVRGEGERPLADLIHHLLAPLPSPRSTPLPDGVQSSAADPNSAKRFSQLTRLDRLPVPNYDDYFQILAGFPAAERFFPTLPIEASRGCWWHRQDSSGSYKGCAFCNLNLQWQGYRTKPTRRVVDEVNHLIDRHQLLGLSFSDNAIAENHAMELFEEIRQLDKDLSIFIELRANATAALIRKMRQAGVETVQVGIEALSSRLLGKMNKGVCAIDNLAIMKHCEASGIINASNLMLHFPSSDADDVAETLQALDFARWYRPLKTVRFWLGLDSPVYRYARRFQIRSVFNHPNLKKLFPDQVAATFNFLIQGYRGDRMRQLRLWRPVEKAVRQWRKDYETMRRQTGGRPTLTVRNGGGFILIEQRLPAQPTARHRLTGVSAEIYRACAITRSLDELDQQFSSHSRYQIRQFCQSLVDKRLMFAEAERYLSLAVPLARRDCS